MRKGVKSANRGLDRVAIPGIDTTGEDIPGVDQETVIVGQGRARVAGEDAIVPQKVDHVHPRIIADTSTVDEDVPCPNILVPDLNRKVPRDHVMVHEGPKPTKTRNPDRNHHRTSLSKKKYLTLTPTRLT